MRVTAETLIINPNEVSRKSFCQTFFKKFGRIFKGATLETGLLRAVALNVKTGLLRAVALNVKTGLLRAVVLNADIRFIHIYPQSKFRTRQEKYRLSKLYGCYLLFH